MSSPDAAQHISREEAISVKYAAFFVKYEVQPKPGARQIGNGSYSNVLLYRRADDHGVELAVKFPRYSEDDEETNKKMDRAYAKDMQRLVIPELKHPNILEYLGLTKAESGAGVGIVMPYASNKSLLAFLNSNKNANRVKILQDVAEGLRYLHKPDIQVDGRSLSITHGDIHPGNVLIKGDGTAVLSDFGLSKISMDNSPNSLTARVNGPDGYAAYIGPELHGSQPLKFINLDGTVTEIHPAVVQHRDYEGRRTPKADIFAFSMLIYETFGIKPIAGLGFEKAPPPEAVMYALVQNRRPDLERITHPEFPGAFYTLIQECWDGDAARRPDAERVCERLKV